MLAGRVSDGMLVVAGLLLAIALWFIGTSYVGFGVAYGRKMGRPTPSVHLGAVYTTRIAKVVGAHPHWGRWVAISGLVMDGVAFSRAKVDGKMGRGPPRYQAVADGEPGRRGSSSGGREKGGGRPERTKEKRSSGKEKSSNKETNGGSTGKSSSKVSHACLWSVDLL